MFNSRLPPDLSESAQFNFLLIIIHMIHTFIDSTDHISVSGILMRKSLRERKTGDRYYQKMPGGASLARAYDKYVG